MDSGASGGLAAVSAAIPDWLLFIGLVIVVLGGIKLTKLLWLVFR